MNLLFCKYENKETSATALVYYDPDFSEFVVKFYKNKIRLKDADYFTSDENDALSTAKVTVFPDRPSGDPREERTGGRKR